MISRFPFEFEILASSIKTLVFASILVLPDKLVISPVLILIFLSELEINVLPLTFKISPVILTAPPSFATIILPSEFCIIPFRTVPCEPLFVIFISPAPKFFIILPLYAVIPPSLLYALMVIEPLSFFIELASVIFVLTKLLNKTSAMVIDSLFDMLLLLNSLIGLPNSGS